MHSLFSHSLILTFWSVTPAAGVALEGLLNVFAFSDTIFVSPKTHTFDEKKVLSEERNANSELIFIKDGGLV